MEILVLMIIILTSIKLIMNIYDLYFTNISMTFSSKSFRLFKLCISGTNLARKIGLITFRHKLLHINKIFPLFNCKLVWKMDFKSFRSNIGKLQGPLVLMVIYLVCSYTHRFDILHQLHLCSLIKDVVCKSISYYFNKQKNGNKEQGKERKIARWKLFVIRFIGSTQSGNGHCIGYVLFWNFE